MSRGPRRLQGDRPAPADLFDHIEPQTDEGPTMTEPQTVTRDVAGEIRAVAARQGVSHAELARRIDRPPMWVSRRLSPVQALVMSVHDLTLMADALGVDPAEVLAAARTTTTT